MTAALWWEQAACRTAPDPVKAEFIVNVHAGRYNPRTVENDQLAKTFNARRVCHTCPPAVKVRCLYELWDDRYAVAGGLVPAQRRGPRPPKPA